MGIYDRDYIRRAAPRRGAYGQGGAAGWRMWSINTWLIVICVAVFFIDFAMPASWVPMEVTPTTVTQEQLETYDQFAHGDVVSRNGIVGVRVLMDPQTGVEVGVQRMQRMQLLRRVLHYSTQRGFLNVEFWRLIGFQFLHVNGMHLLFNMMGLFFFGPMVEQYLGRKRYLAFYLLCGMCGALLYSMLNLGGIAAEQMLQRQTPIPFLLPSSPFQPLIGASAGVFGVLMAGARLAPNVTVLLFFFFPMRLQTLAYLLVGVSVFTLFMQGHNAGGEAGHLGGAIAGFYFIRHPHHLHGFFDFLGRVDPSSHHYAHMWSRGTSPRAPRTQAEADMLDRILEKVSREGLQSLTPRERRILERQSRR